MEQHLFWQIALQILLIFLNAVFACAEIAVISINKNRLAQLVGQGNKGAVRLEKLTQQPARFLATIQVAITLSGLLGSAFAADNFSDMLTKKIISLGVRINPEIIDTVSVIAITLILSYFTLVFGELVPKRIAMKKSEKLALGMSSSILFISKLFAPVVWLLTASTNGILRLLGINPDEKSDDISEEDIRLMIEAGMQKGVIDSEENEFIHNVFEFDDITAGELATHRTEVSILYAEDPPEKWEKIIHETRHTLYPVCQNNADNVIGILNIKDYFRLKYKSIENAISYAVTAPYFIPENLNAAVLFKQMRKSRNCLAIVLDEYGGFSGIVTLNDLIERLVGSLDENTQRLNKIDEHSWEISGSVSLKEAAEELNTDLPVDDYETFGGYIFGIYGSIPDDGSTFNINTDYLNINVLKINEHRIEKAIVTAVPSQEHDIEQKK